MASKTIDVIYLASSNPEFLDSISEVAKQSEEGERVFLGKNVEADGFFELSEVIFSDLSFSNNSTARKPLETLSEAANKVLDVFCDKVGTTIQTISFTHLQAPLSTFNILGAPTTEFIKFSNPIVLFLTQFENLLVELCVLAPGCLGGVVGWEVDSDGYAEKKNCVKMFG